MICGCNYRLSPKTLPHEHTQLHHGAKSSHHTLDLALATMFMSISPDLESFAFAPISWMRKATWEPRYVLKEFLSRLRRYPESRYARGLRNLRTVRLLPWGRGTPGIYASYRLSVCMNLVGHTRTRDLLHRRGSFSRYRETQACVFSSQDHPHSSVMSGLSCFASCHSILRSTAGA